MNGLITFGLSLTTAVVGLFCGAFIGDKFARWFGVSNAEGGQSLYMLMLAVVGGFVGLIVGLVVIASLSPQNGVGYLKATGVAAASAMGLAALIFAVGWLRADHPPKIDGRPLRFEVEVRLPRPASVQLADSDELPVDLHLGRAIESQAWISGNLKIKAAPMEDGRWLVEGSTSLYRARPDSTLGVKIQGQDVAAIALPLPANPARDALHWSGWTTVPAAPTSPWAGSNLTYRFRVQKVAPPPPPLSSTEYAARAAAAKQAAAQAAFDAVAPDAPVVEQLALTVYGTPDEHRAIALERMRTRPTFIAEVRALITGDDHETAAAALRIIPHLPHPAPDLLDPVALAGRDIARRLRAVNELTREQDPSYEAAATISIRFSAWMSAVHTLREKSGGDFTPELGEILVLSRLRPDSIALRSDVCRVASFYMHEWAGLAPLPDDPKPR